MRWRQPAPPWSRPKKTCSSARAWALRLEEEKRQLEDQLIMVRASRWIKLGRKVGLGPAL
jgi:hypothetical protein